MIKTFILVLLQTTFSMIFADQDLVVFGVSIVMFTMYAMSFYNDNIVTKLILLTIVSIPTSYVSITGGPYAELPISWFNIFGSLLVIFYCAQSLLNSTARLNRVSILACIMIALLLLPLVLSGDIVDGTKQYVNILFFFLFVIIGNSIKITNDDINMLLRAYISTALATGILLFVILILFYYFSITLGTITYMGASRIAFGVLFTDFSFLSLYLSSAAILSMCYGNKVGNRIYYIIFFLLLLSSIATSARTGAVAVFVMLTLIIIYQLRSRPLLSVSIMIFFAMLSVVSYGLISELRSADDLGDSGRLDGYLIALNYIVENPWFGAGLGVRTYKILSDSAIPHNLFIQMLAQVGIPITLVLSIFLMKLVSYCKKVNPIMLVPLLTIIVGAQFIPDILNSRFISIISLIACLGTKLKQEGTI